MSIFDCIEVDLFKLIVDGGKDDLAVVAVSFHHFEFEVEIVLSRGRHFRYFLHLNAQAKMLS